MQAKCCGDTSVRHAEIDGFNSLRLLRSFHSLRRRGASGAGTRDARPVR